MILHLTTKHNNYNRINLNPRREEFCILLLSQRLFNCKFCTSQRTVFLAFAITEDFDLHAFIVAFWHAMHAALPLRRIRRRHRHYHH